MKKSIETIWKEGFLENDALVAPKVNNLYNQKSRHLVEQFIRLGKRNLYAIMGGAFFFLVVSFFVEVPFFGTFLFLLLGSLVIIGKKQTKALGRIDKSMDSYHYLKAFDQWLKASSAEYTRIYKFIYPAIFATFTVGLLLSNLNRTSLWDKIIQDPDTYLVNGLPVVWIGVALLLLVVVSIFSGKIYQLDVQTIYGGITKKIEEILSDMEELRE